MRIIAGHYKRQPLLGPRPQSPIRPTSDQGRELCFNILQHSHHMPEDFWSRELVVLDAFAGTGAWGLEALSRGAKNVIFFDIHNDALSLIKQNIERLSKLSPSSNEDDLSRPEKCCRVLRVNAVMPPPASKAADLIFLDPPYGSKLISRTLKSLLRHEWIGLNSIIVIEQEARQIELLPDVFHLWDQRTTGAACFQFLSLNATIETADNAS